jgi:ketopantoate reductase
LLGLGKVTMVKINFEILGKEWTLKVLKRKRYKKKNGADSIAICYGWKRRIDVHTSVTHEDLAHEIVHAYMNEMCINSTTEMTAADMEEFFAEFYSKRGQEGIDLVNNLMKEIQKVLEPKITLVQKMFDEEEN